jgi:threonine/homoserine/homoserine lactone efflux protein
MTSDFGAFLGVSAMLIMTPGQDTALVIRNSLAGGTRAGVFSGLGVAAGQVVWTIASAVGVTALLLASAPAFHALRLAGAAYLVFLGARALYEALAMREKRMNPRVASGASSVSRATAFRQGALSALGNAKLAVFFVSLFPQFIPAGGAAATTCIVLGLCFTLMCFTWLCLYATAVGKFGELLGRTSTRRAIQTALGAFLVAFGVKLAT